MSSEDMSWRNAGEVFASGNSNSPKHYSFMDKNLEANFYSYRLKMIDNDGTFEYSNEVHTEINLADEFELSQNYPNPFNPETIITYKLPEKSHVALQIFNILGNEIAEIINEEKSAGVHKVKVDISVIAPELSNGTYFYRLKAGNYTETKKMIYLK
ncbi:MAG: T9SS C-terminal target domain-containing protein [Ignavibacteriales bacterium]|nr:MAG: T9SS C-terminal target domain-containing protein [Ignavibacteriales bacterium]